MSAFGGKADIRGTLWDLTECLLLTADARLTEGGGGVLRLPGPVLYPYPLADICSSADHTAPLVAASASGYAPGYWGRGYWGGYGYGYGWR